MITGMMAGREDRFKWTRNQGKVWYSAHCKSFSFTRPISHCRQNSWPFKRSSGSYPDISRFLWKLFQLIIIFKSVDYQNILYLFPMQIITCKTGKAG
jgi:hypothetical protein